MRMPKKEREIYSSNHKVKEVKMATVEYVVLEFFEKCRKKDRKCPLMLWKMNSSGKTATPPL